MAVPEPRSPNLRLHGLPGGRGRRRGRLAPRRTSPAGGPGAWAALDARTHLRGLIKSRATRESIWKSETGSQTNSSDGRGACASGWDTPRLLGARVRRSNETFGPCGAKNDTRIFYVFFIIQLKKFRDKFELWYFYSRFIQVNRAVISVKNTKF